MTNDGEMQLEAENMAGVASYRKCCSVCGIGAGAEGAEEEEEDDAPGKVAVAVEFMHSSSCASSVGGTS